MKTTKKVAAKKIPNKRAKDRAGMDERFLAAFEMIAKSADTLAKAKESDSKVLGDMLGMFGPLMNIAVGTKYTRGRTHKDS